MKPLLPVIACGLLCGCLTTVGPDYRSPELATPAEFRLPAEDLINTSAQAADARFWWQGYADPILGELVEESLQNNLDIAAARSRLKQARALTTVARSNGGPTLDAGADLNGSSILAGRNARDTEGAASGSLLFSWDPDLFGGLRREVESAEASERRQALLTQDTTRLIAAEVVRQYLNLQRSALQLTLVRQSLDLQRQTLDLAEQRFDAGIGSLLDVSRARAQLAATRAQIGPIQSDLASSQTALSVLIADMDTVIVPDQTPGIPIYAEGPAPGLPRDLLRRRPDVQAAEAELARTTAEIGVAEAELYPRLNIPGVLTASATGFGAGEVVTAIIASLAASLDIPLFDQGGRRASVDAAEARTEEALLAYRQQLLLALAEAETALAQVEATSQRQRDLQQAVEASTRAYEQAQDLYTQGLVGFLDVLDAERSLLSNRQSLADADTDYGVAIADFYTAIGAPAVAQAEPIL
jgi:NodT family efflux transporter outer membrane factor (OMF) lipoprotein